MIWHSFYDQHGERVQEAAGRTLEEAKRHRSQRLHEVADGTFARGLRTGGSGVAAYAKTWIALRREEGVRTVDREEQILRDHILPHLGSKRLDDVRPRDVAAWIRKVSPTLAPKSVINAHGVLSAMFARARFDELVVDNPAKGLPRGILPKNVRSRRVGAWTRDEVAMLISHPGIPEDRRVAYAVSAFTGARCGEVAGLRWRDLDTKARPLWRWHLEKQYDGQPLKGRGAQGGPPRDIPIHIELERVLEAWRTDGWARFMRRHAQPADFVCPRENGKVHSKQSLGAKAVHRHAVVAGLSSEGRDFHSFRRALITIARTDGAVVDVLERITHNSAGEQIDGYTYFGWETLCAAISCVRLAPATIAPVIPVAPARGRSEPPHPVTVAVTRSSEPPDSPRNPGALSLEAPGVEPGSESAPWWLLRVYPAFCIAIRLARRAGSPYRYRPFIFALLPSRVERASQFGDASTRALTGSSLRRLSVQLIRPRERRCYRSHLQIPGCF
ncbi:Phage integrase [Sandaracinus amylolyticus]|uniref:Phage integrase n=1 Tax=Sandaracinus amylolyticus TaxID=927083 RepID=A0A0F6W335_9BACT|nr:Phage integrase [Sandaracinus amylolyticus]